MASRYNQAYRPSSARIDNSYGSSSEAEINILLMGQTGTGKTTFINSFINYLLYDSLDHALKNELHVLIPSKFIFMDKDTFNEETILVGDHSRVNAECERVGQSSTKSCRSYLFKIRNRLIRLIDVPGIGDTRNIDQDAINLDHILAYLTQYTYLNGICIFLKANEARATTHFRYCIKEVLRQLHFSAKENIMFVFTHSRPVNYGPGDSTTLVKNFLADLKKSTNVEVPFNRGNCFFFDNESFRFVATYRHGISAIMSQKGDMKRSWVRSVDESYRMMESILKCGVHSVQNTRCLAEAKQLMSQLARPIAEAVKLIEDNESMAENYKQKILKNPSNQGDDFIPQNSVEFVELPKRLTVCINPGCTQVVNVNGEIKVDYHKHCHDDCYLNNVVQECIGHPILRNCAAMTPEGTCTNCGCKWQDHMHVTYKLAKVSQNYRISDPSGSRSRTPAAIITLIDRRITDLRKESKKIRELCVQLSSFIKKNSIVSFNDDIFEYLQLELKEALKLQGTNDANRKRAKNLQDMIDYYTEESKLYRTAPGQTEPSLQVDEKELKNFFVLVEELYKLPITGDMIKMQVERMQRGRANLAPTQETHAEVPIVIGGSHFLSKLSGLVDPSDARGDDEYPDYF